MKGGAVIGRKYSHFTVQQHLKQEKVTHVCLFIRFTLSSIHISCTSTRIPDPELVPVCFDLGIKAAGAMGGGGWVGLTLLTP